MVDPRFSYESFVRASDRERLSRELAAVLTERVCAAAAPAEEGHRIADELRQLGHDLWSFDESTDFQEWCGSWKGPKRSHEILVSVSYRDGEPRNVAVTFRVLEPA